MKYIIRFIKGLLVGCVNIIPGVSAGTIAVVTNVYDEIIIALSLDFKYIKKNFWKLLALGLGVIVGIVLFSKIIRFLFNNYYRSTMNFFVGLVIGSIPLLVKNALNLKEDSKRWVKWVVAGLCFAVVLTYSILMKGDDNSAVITTLSTGTFLRLMGLVAVSSIAMILPGLSGSLMMMFFGIYNTVIGAIADFNFVMLIPVILGSIIGIVVGSITLKWLLNRFGKTSNFAIVALVLASLLGVYIAYVLPNMAFDLVLIADICALAAGVVGGYFLCMASQKGKKNETAQEALQTANAPIQLPDATVNNEVEVTNPNVTNQEENDQPPKNE